MGLRGPAPTPTKVLKMRGTYRPDRHGGSEPPSETLTKVPRAPSNLRSLARKLWRQIAKQLIAGERLATDDLQSLEGYVIAYERALESEAVVAVQGRTTKTSQGLGRHPELITAEKARAEMRVYEQKFGMSPADRARLRLKPVKAAPAVKDPWDDVANGTA
jgi:P27 family predicted phage terminase small subunit